MKPSIPIQYVVGDATRPIGAGIKIIAHCCNDVGVWGAGFVLALSRRWKRPEESYLNGFDVMNPGGVQFVKVEDDIIVANIIGQHRTGPSNGVPPVRYAWLHSGFQKIEAFAAAYKASVHMPRLGCGLAGGQWPVVEALILEDLSEKGIPVFVYDLPSKS